MELTKRGERSVGQRLALMRRHEAEVRKQMDELRVCAERIAFKVWYYETAKREGLKAGRSRRFGTCRRMTHVPCPSPYCDGIGAVGIPPVPMAI